MVKLDLRNNKILAILILNFLLNLHLTNHLFSPNKPQTKFQVDLILILNEATIADIFKETHFSQESIATTLNSLSICLLK